MLRRGDHKYIVGEASPPQLFDLATDPLELQNLAGSPANATLEAAFAREVSATWNFPELREAVIASQRRRRFVFRALRRGAPKSWDFQPHVDATERYARNLTGALGDQERLARLPRSSEPLPDGPAAKP
jgi:choline-sulfatase